MNKNKRILKYIYPVLVYALAVFVIILNASLMFDNVVWGDEAFSANTAKSSFRGIIEILYYCDNHPPLHYIWTKLFGEIFGHTILVYHLAALVPFIIGIILAVTFFRKRFGNIPAAFFIIISGLGAFCIEYNLEIRMYSLAFLGVLATFYCAYRVISEGRKSAWMGMVLWALVAAYSHYYALVTVGILMFVTSVVVWIKNRGKSWLKGFGAIAIFLIGYAPWLYFLFTAMRNVSNNWWMTDILSLRKTVSMITGGSGLNIYILLLVIVLSVVLLVAESGIVRFREENGKKGFFIQKPSIKGWSDETYTVVMGIFTIIGTVAFAYLVCYVFKPMLAQRYMYPLSAVTFGILVIAMSRVFLLLHKLCQSVGLFRLETVAKAVSLIFLALFILIGMRNFKAYKEVAVDQSIKTNATLSLIGEPEEDTILVTNGVKHLGWTIFPCYFPETEFVNGNYFCSDKDKFWYFSPTSISEKELQYLAQVGYDVISYGQMQISQYPFLLYYIEK